MQSGVMKLAFSKLLKIHIFLFSKIDMSLCAMIQIKMSYSDKFQIKYKHPISVAVAALSRTSIYREQMVVFNCEFLNNSSRENQM